MTEGKQYARSWLTAGRCPLGIASLDHKQLEFWETLVKFVSSCALTSVHREESGILSLPCPTVSQSDNLFAYSNRTFNDCLIGLVCDNSFPASK